MHGRLRLTVTLLLITSALAVAIGAAQKTAAPRGDALPPSDQSLQRAARSASTNEPDAVRQFTNELLRSSPITSSAAASLADRVYKTELAFRSGAHPGIFDDDVIAATNDEVRRFGLPSHDRVTKGQFQLVREDLEYFTRGFASHRSHAEVMSPAEALYIVSDLAVQKIANPEYQVEPEQWEHDSRARRGLLTASVHKVHSMKPLKVSVSVNQQPANVQLDLSNESSVTVREAHAILDRLGFQR